MTLKSESVRLLSQCTTKSYLWGFLGPFALLISATGVELRPVMFLVIVTWMFGIFGSFILSVTGLDSLTDSPLGGVVLGITLAIALSTLSGQMFHSLVGYQYSWLVLPITALIIGVRTTRANTQTFAVRSPRTSNAQHNLLPLWVLIYLVLGVSSPIFTVTAGVLVLVHLILKGTNWGRKKISKRDSLCVWLGTGTLYITGIALNWRSKSPWAFSLASPDTHIWTAKAWSSDLFGWMRDPTTSGVPSSYHFFGQATAGLVSRLTHVPEIATVGFVIPVLVVASSYFVVRKLISCENPSWYASWTPLLVLLASFSPLEPNSPLSTESFTFLVSIAYLVISLAIMEKQLKSPSALNSFVLLFLAIVTTAAKVNTGAILACIGIALAATNALHPGRQRPTIIFRDALACIFGFGVVMAITYFGVQSGSSYRIQIGFGALDYRFALVGGPYPGPSIAVLLLIVLYSPALICLLWFIDGFRSSRSSGLSPIIERGLLLVALGLFGGSLLFQFPPVSKAEFYFSTVGLVVFTLVGARQIRPDGNWPQRLNFTQARRWKIVVTVCFITSLVSSAILWHGRAEHWPSLRTFLIAYLIPWAASVTGLVHLHRELWGKENRDLGFHSGIIRRFMAVFFLLTSSIGVSIVVSYGIRGPLKTAVGVINNEVTLQEFLVEIRESSDRSSTYRSTLNAIAAVTQSDDVIAVDIGFDGTLFVASEAKRQLWWSPYAEHARGGAIADHLSWRKMTLDSFLAAPSAESARSMRRCGATHVVVPLEMPGRDWQDYEIPNSTSVQYRTNSLAVFTLTARVSDADIPNSEWLRWCSAGT